MPESNRVPSPPGSSLDADARRAFGAMQRIVRALRINARSIEAHAGIRLAQLFVLQQLIDRLAESLNELATRTLTEPSSVSVVVQRLVAARLVERTDRSGGRLELALTRAGRLMVANAPPTMQTRMLDGLAKIADRDRRTLAELLESWLREATIEVIAPPMFSEEDAADHGTSHCSL